MNYPLGDICMKMVVEHNLQENTTMLVYCLNAYHGREIFVCLSSSGPVRTWRQRHKLFMSSAQLLEWVIWLPMLLFIPDDKKK